MRSSQRHQHSRDGAVYLITLGATLMVSLLGMAALMNVQIRRAQSGHAAAMLEARNYARVAINMAQHRARTDPLWRSKLANGAWDVAQPIGNGSYRFRAADPGALTGADYDPVVITGTGISGPARQMLQATLLPSAVGLDCLTVGVHADTSLHFGDVQFSCDQSVSSNNLVSANSSQVNSRVEAVNDIVGESFEDVTTTGIAPRSLPGSNVFDYYLFAGTSIAFENLPSGSAPNSKRIQGELISPAHNPWGNVSSAGIYFVDCGGNSIEISDSRIISTLVFLNASQVEIKNSVSWEAPFPHFPALLVAGNAHVHLSSTDLDEQDVQKNLNPTGAPFPYPQGSSNNDDQDRYPSRVRGLVYVSGHILLYGETSITGVILSGESCICSDPGGGSAEVAVSHDSIFSASPPPGFEKSFSIIVERGSWRQIVE